MGKKELGLT